MSPPLPRTFPHTVRLSLLGLALLAAAHTTPAADPRALDAVPAQRYELPAGPLSSALAGFAVRAGIALSFDPALTEGRSSPGLSGHYAAREALDQLLAGSGLVLVARPDGSYALVKAPPAVSMRPAATTEPSLPEVTVTAVSQAELAKGPVVGYVARRTATATKTDTALIESPQSISVVSAEEIGDRKAESLDETLRYTAGVAPNSKPWAADQYSLLRGFEVGATGAYLDGLLSPNGSAMASIEPYGLERLEVVRGPASVLYGQMAPGGMVNAVSKAPTRDTVREVGVEYGTYDRKQLKADFGGALDAEGVWTYRLTMLGRRSGTPLDLDKDNRVFVAPSLTWQPGVRTRLTVRAMVQEDDQSYAWGNQLQSPGALGQPSTGVNIGGYDNRWKRTNKMLGYEFEHQFDGTWTLRQNLRYSDLHRTGTDVFPLGLGSDGRSVRRALSPRTNDWQGLLVDTQVQARFRTGPVGHTALAGYDYARSRMTLTRRHANALMPDLDLYAPVYAPQPLTPSATPFKDKTPTTQQGLYVQDQMKWEQWVLTAGLRHDEVDQSSKRTRLDTGETTVNYEQTSRATTSRVGLVRLFDSGWAPYVSYATSFAPETGTSLSGEPLKPSRGRQVEAGVRYQPAQRSISYTAAVFDLVRDNVSTAAPGGSGALVQTGEVASRGAEMEVRAALGAGVSLVAQYTYLDTEVVRSNNGDEGLALRGAPRHSASAWGKYSFGVAGHGQAFAALGLRHLGQARSGQDWGNANLMNPRLTIVDTALGFEHEGWRVSLNIDNLFDTEKRIDCDGTFCYRSGGRTASLSALYRF